MAKTSKKTDEKVGKECWFEHHCEESHSSCDAHLWYRSQQKVKVLKISQSGGGNTIEKRVEAGDPRVYRIKFADGFEFDAFEDEVLNSPSEFVNQPPPLPPVGFNELNHLAKHYGKK